MSDASASLPEQLIDGADSARGVSAQIREGSVASIVVLGMGGSGIVGEAVRALSSTRVTVPVESVNDYEIPSHVGESSIVFAVSFSGETEETLEAARAAHGAGARIVAVTKGGSLATFAHSIGAPVVITSSNVPEPRAALGSMLAPILVVLEELDLYRGARSEIEEAAAHLRGRRDRLGVEDSAAQSIALRIGRTFPFICGASGIGAVAARRWKTQVNENAKSPAFFAVQPELCHNEVCGFGQSGDVTRQLLTLVELRSDFEHPRTRERFAIVAELLRETLADIVSVRAEGSSPLAQLLDLIMVGDFVSLSLAFEEGVDPGPVPVLKEIKEALEKVPKER